MPFTRKPSYPNRPWLIQDLIKERSFTLIGGGSGSGKSTWVFQGFHEWFKEGTFHGFKCYRTPRVWLIAFDRLIESIHDHLNILNINFTDDDGLDWMDIRSCALDEYSEKFPLILPDMSPGDLLVLEGIDMLVGGGNLKDFGAVNHLCKRCKQAIDKLDISVIGVMGATKSSKVELLAKGDPFDKLIGSGVWQRTSETNIMVEKGDASDTENCIRVVHIRPRFSKPLVIEYQFTPDSRLIRLPGKSKETLGMHKLVFFECLPQQFDLFTAIRIGKENGLSRATVCRYLKSLEEDDKLIEKTHYGNYRKCKDQR